VTGGRTVALPHHYTGKVRDLYEVDHDRMLIVASDRISVFDVVLDDPIPDKGRVLTGLAAFWFEQTADVVPSHLISADPTDFPETAGPEVSGRAMLVRATQPIRIECVARGYLFGSAWDEYAATATVGGRRMPTGLQLAERLTEPMFTATTKAPIGEHDLPLTEREAAALVGDERFEQLREMTLRLYGFAAGRAEASGVILADTKFEFGTVDDEVLLIDEIFTPDSSRYWPVEDYRVGSSPPSFDKQFVRDHYHSIGWDHQPPAPRLPDEVIAGTRARYVEAYELLTGESFDEWFSPDE
jgi:phosphoribosylaminoimidazole-succinocarboxamide synthase